MVTAQEYRTGRIRVDSDPCPIWSENSIRVGEAAQVLDARAMDHAGDLYEIANCVDPVEDGEG